MKLIEFYEIFYEILFFISSLGLVIGMVNPGLVLLWTYKKTRIRVLLIYGTAMFIFLILTSLMVYTQNELKIKPVKKAKGVLTEWSNIGWSNGVVG